MRGAPPPDELELLLDVVPGLSGVPFVGREQELGLLTRLGARKVPWVSGLGVPFLPLLTTPGRLPPPQGVVRACS
ncbi:hypothetical protein GCM10010840_11320 [Deinococcus aerolatus]|uniref:Uncharacterized protein n=1 Tax=Deinococcus aerolatus TaxID=522487 RepID=A0ABQ2G4E9_9DEIO|nr:hypothetical protein [Deinococcus aerolatus]GGL74982.1 hypothetical protein GCM10010840_11320 [Deinococcus aerolatus]